MFTFHMSHQAAPTTTITARRETRIEKKAITPSVTDIIQHPRDLQHEVILTVMLDRSSHFTSSRKYTKIK